MNMVSVNELLVNVAQIARKTPTPTLRRAYVRALRDWCSQTQWLRTNIDGQLTQGTRQYQLGNDPHLEIIGIFAMQGSQTVGGNGNLQFWGIGASDSSLWNPNLQPSMPVRYQYIPEAQFAVDPLPQQTYGVAVTVILQPKETSVMVPEAPLLKYSNEIEAGALEYLLNIPGMPYSSPVIAQSYGKVFRAGISNGKAEVQRNYNTGPVSVRARPFGGGFNRGRGMGAW